MFLELLVQVFTDTDVLEHPLQFGRVLEAARLLHDDKNKRRFSRTCSELLWVFLTQADCVRSHLEFRDHAGLGVVAGAVLVDQTFGQHLSIKLLEDIFVLDVLEHNHLQEERQRVT